MPAVSRIARAQTYPTRPVHLVVGYPPGGVTDIIARLIAPWLSERLGQQIVVENRAGASSNIATEAVARALPDGYTLLLISSSNAANVTLYDNLNFDFLRDIAAGREHWPGRLRDGRQPIVPSQDRAGVRRLR